MCKHEILTLLFFGILIGIYAAPSTPSTTTLSALNPTSLPSNETRVKRQAVTIASRIASSEFIVPTLGMLMIKMNDILKSVKKMFNHKNCNKLINEKTVKIVTKRSRPIFNNHTANERKIIKKRSVLEFNSAIESTSGRRKRAIPPLVPFMARLIAWGGMMTASGVAIAVIQKSMEAESKLKRIQIDCKSNSVGCLSNICWSNCGPRLDKADWCYAGNSSVINGTRTVQLQECEHDSDCNPCTSCASVCFKQEEMGEYDTVNSTNQTPTTVSRKKRGLFLPILYDIPIIKEYFGWTTWFPSTPVIDQIDQTARVFDTAFGKKLYGDINDKNIQIDCKFNNAGCLNNVCWSNCGSRFDKLDWCFTGETSIVNNTRTVQLNPCKHDSDCKPCFSCASECFREEDFNENNNDKGNVTNINNNTDNKEKNKKKLKRMK